MFMVTLMSTWIEPQLAAVPDELTRALGGHPLVQSVLVQRGITNPDQALAFLTPIVILLPLR